MSRPKMPNRRNYVVDKGVDVALYVAIDAISIYLTNHTFSLSSLPLDSLLLVLALIGIVALVITYILAAPVHKKIEQKRGRVEPEEAIGFDLCREEDRPQIEALLNEAERNSTIWVMGIDCTYWLDDCGKKVKEYVTGHDLSFIFLVAKPGSVILETASEARLISLGSKTTIESSISLFQEMKSELKEKGGKIQLGIYDLPLVHSMVVVNPNTHAERIQVTHYLYKVPWVDRPILTLRRQLLTKEQQAVFDGYHNSIKYALDNAKDQQGRPLETGRDRTKLEEKTWEFDVKWHLTRDIQPSPPFGSEDIPGSETASSLHVSQRREDITITGNMACLKPSRLYAVYLAKPYRPFELVEGSPSTVKGEKPYAQFPTDDTGNGDWVIHTDINALTRHGITDRLVVWVNDAPKDKTLLGSDSFPIHL